MSGILIVSKFSAHLTNEPCNPILILKFILPKHDFVNDPTVLKNPHHPIWSFKILLDPTGSKFLPTMRKFDLPTNGKQTAQMGFFWKIPKRIDRNPLGDLFCYRHGCTSFWLKNQVRGRTHVRTRPHWIILVLKPNLKTKFCVFLLYIGRGHCLFRGGS